MSRSDHNSILLLLAGAKGAIGSTVCVAAHLLKHHPELICPWLTTTTLLPTVSRPELIAAGWDCDPIPLADAIHKHGVLPPGFQGISAEAFKQVIIHHAPPAQMALPDQVARVQLQMETLQQQFPHSQPVLINLLPSSRQGAWQHFCQMEELEAAGFESACPDLVYALAAVQCGIPVVNFTPNSIENPLLLELARHHQVPLCGRDGKTGQTYFKVVLASALKARHLLVDGWYSLNILGNADGYNLMAPDRAAGKLAHKTQLLDELLGYRVGQRYDGCAAHKVHIDYYPPRGDAKEAWDVIDFRGLFDLPMSLRVNLQGRDSILAAPMVVDLARWMVVLQSQGRWGLVSELGFYFKRPLGEGPGVTFQEQMAHLEALASAVAAGIADQNKGGC